MVVKGLDRCIALCGVVIGVVIEWIEAVRDMRVVVDGVVKMVSLLDVVLAREAVLDVDVNVDVTLLMMVALDMIIW